MCDQQSLRSACACVQSDRSLCLSLECSVAVWLLAGRRLGFLCLGAVRARLGLRLSECHIVGSHMFIQCFVLVMEYILGSGAPECIFHNQLKTLYNLFSPDPGSRFYYPICLYICALEIFAIKTTSLSKVLLLFFASFAFRAPTCL